MVTFSCMPLWSSVLLALLSLAVITIAVLARARAQRRQARRLYRDRLAAAVADGTLTPDEVAELEGLRMARDLSHDEVRMAALAIYRAALRDALSDERLTPEEDLHLRRLQADLDLSDEELEADHVQLSRLRFLAQLEGGMLPQIHSPVPLVAHEVGHWVVRATFADRIALARSVDDPTGIRLDVGGTDAFRAEGPRDALRPSEAVLPVDMGVLVVSSRRIVFQGVKRTVSIPHARLAAIALYTDGIRAEEQGGAVRGYFLVDDAELTAAVLLYAARKRRAEIRPLRPGRTA